jgi:mycothiol synthase
MTPSLPPEYELRSATLDEIGDLARFFIDYDLAVSGYSDFTEDDLREISKRTSVFDIAKDTWVVTFRNRIAALALMWGGDSDFLNAIGAVGRAHVGLGLGSLLVDCTEERAVKLALERPSGRLVLRNSVDVNDRDGIALILRRGYEMVRRHYTMRRFLDNEIDLQVPSAIRIRACRQDDVPILYRLHAETFADHWGHRPATYEEWSDAFLARTDTEPSLWWLAETDGDPIGFLIATFEGPRGWVSDVGVVSSWRRRGIGSALLRHAFSEFRRRGFTEAGLEVDAGNETGAVRIYERAGLEVVREYETFEKSIDAVAKG